MMVAHGASTHHSGLHRQPKTELFFPRGRKHGYTSDGFDNYWAPIDITKKTTPELRHQLRNAGCHGGKQNTRREDIAELYRTQIHHQLGYSKLEYVELTRFIEDRGLVVVEETSTTRAASRSAKDHDFSKSSKQALVATLAQADSNPLFPRFFNLPAELQMLVSDTYLKDIASGRKHGLRYPTQRPLPRTCHQICHAGCLPLLG